MIVHTILYTKKFQKELRKLPPHIIDLAVKKESLFKKNPLHPSLRLHGLHRKFEGVWSISLSGNYRIIFQRMENGDILFISIGSHDIYKYL